MIKIGIDPSGTGTTGIVIYEDNKLVKQHEFKNKDWKEHFEFIDGFILEYLYSDYYVKNKGKILSDIRNIEDCLYTNANGSKDRDDLLRLLGAIENTLFTFNFISPKYTKSVVKNMENLSKYNNSCLWKYDKDPNLTYQYGKGWFYNNEKISNHLRDAIIIANYER
ncbi:hypothetical protein [Spiroplasma phoeniceum]|uniref:Uncharacterized protein n=1 Tax=Spiroplasma phoeniceum P40 TaxID=1276259 RepID=A0A345DS15_9MOLU|nr:hypothetical protein [Spiroplasma phoeniceum]AXF96445.1 hypothetical protein SDAV_001478 [Spiroplasma phoeniceum P40]AXF97006.1 hypothetical protein SDAV_002073 [Spiroplasma phoeniceum P40]AXF97035.1 hypothetical protein SDAV_002102 [Spiroplasma phoeniceum P40]AXF97073.1 hypothetical protein SDAV_002140 [Spiroplasma phoeniceum P40]